MRILLAVEIEVKDEWEGGDPRPPAPGEVAMVLQDRMIDATRGDFELSWMVQRAEEVTS